MNYMIVATQASYDSTIAGNVSPRWDTDGHYSAKWADTIQLAEMFGTSIYSASGSIIKLCRAPHKKFGMQSGEGRLRQCNKDLSTFMRSLKFTMTGYTITAIPITHMPTADQFATIDQFAYDMTMSPKYIHAVMFATLLPDYNVMHYIAGTEERNHPKPSRDSWADLTAGDIIEYTHSVSHSNMSDGWDHSPAETKYMLVTKVKTSSFSYRHLTDFNKETFEYSGMSEYDETTKKKITGNQKHWDFFYNQYYWQDHIRIVEILRL